MSNYLKILMRKEVHGKRLQLNLLDIFMFMGITTLDLLLK